jgi:hypothetical protein
MDYFALDEIIPSYLPIRSREYDPRPNIQVGVRTLERGEPQVAFQNGDLRVHCFLNWPQ